MAKLSAHGKEVARLQKDYRKVSFHEEGTILKNIGYGWKKEGSVKKGLKGRSEKDKKEIRLRLEAEIKKLKMVGFVEICK